MTENIINNQSLLTDINDSVNNSSSADEVVNAQEANSTIMANKDSAQQPNNPALNNSAQNNSWYLQENIKGTGEKPSWLLDKYKNVSEQAKALPELNKKFGAFTGAPDGDYKIDYAALYTTENDELLKEVTTTARELNMNQEALDKLLSLHQKSVTPLLAAVQNIESLQTRFEEEQKKLTPQDKSFLSNIKDAIKDFPENEKTAIANSFVTHDAITAFSKILNLRGETTSPLDKYVKASSDNKPFNKTDYEDAIRIKDTNGKYKYDVDIDYAKQVDALLARSVNNWQKN